MKRLALAVVLASAVATPARAQMLVFTRTNDTAIGVRSGATSTLRIEENSGYYVQSLRLVLNYDSTKLQVVGLDTLQSGLSSMSIAFAPGRDTITAIGGAYYALVGVRVQLKSGVTDGTWIWARPDTMLTSSGDLSLATTSRIGQVCHGTWDYGDVDQNNRVDSRDALIALTAAVGLPVSGFAIDQNGDMDGDGLSNSRDALVMLSASVGVNTGFPRVGLSVPDGCPGLKPAGEDIVYMHDGGTLDTLFHLPGNATAAVPIPNTANTYLYSPRLAANGVDIVYVCRSSVTFYDELCRTRVDGSVQSATTGSLGLQVVDWFPNQQQVAYRRGYNVFRADSNGANEVLLATPPCCATGVMVRRDGSRVGYDDNSGLGDADPGGTGQFAPFGPSFQGLYDPKWLPGDSVVAAMRSTYDGIFEITVSTGAMRRVVSMDIGNGYYAGYDVGGVGYIFAYTVAGREGLWLAPIGGGALRRLTNDPNVYDPSLRRAP